MPQKGFQTPVPSQGDLHQQRRVTRTSWQSGSAAPVAQRRLGNRRVFILQAPWKGRGGWGHVASGGGRWELGEGPGGQVHASRKEGEQGTAPAASPAATLSWEALGKSFSIPMPQFPCLTNPKGGRRWNQRDDWMWKHEKQALPSTHWLCNFSQVIGRIQTSLLNRRPLSLSLLVTQA